MPSGYAEHPAGMPSYPEALNVPEPRATGQLFKSGTDRRTERAAD